MQHPFYMEITRELLDDLGLREVSIEPLEGETPKEWGVRLAEVIRVRFNYLSGETRRAVAIKHRRHYNVRDDERSR